MVDGLIIEPMVEDLLLWRCLYCGPQTLLTTSRQSAQ